MKHFRLLLILSMFLCAFGVRGQDFSMSDLQGATVNLPTSMKYGPDGRIYVSEQTGSIKILSVERKGKNSYAVTKTETVDLVKQRKNWTDQGFLSPQTQGRQVTGIFVEGTATQPVIWASSSDPRHGGPGETGDKNLDTNSGRLHRLTWNAGTSSWDIVDVVRGLPRSEENHATNGLQIATVNGKKMLYMAVGGNANAGAPGQKFQRLGETVFSAAIISFDLTAIEAMPVWTDPRTGEKVIYDLPTVDDPDRQNITNTHPQFPYPSGHPYHGATIDIGDPFGGHDGLNQAKLVAGSPVQVYAPGFRNPYDLLITANRRMYVSDNGANPGWGGFPENEGTGEVTNNYWDANEPGGSVQYPSRGIYINNQDHLELITGSGTIDNYTPGSYYGGHPNPIRANPTGAGWYTDNGKIECWEIWDKVLTAQEKAQYASKDDFALKCAAVDVWRTSKTGANPLPQDWPPLPVEMANPVEGEYWQPGKEDKAITIWTKNTNALAEYTASNHGNKYKGNIISGTSFGGGRLMLLKLNAAGQKLSLDEQWVNLTNGDGANFVLGIVTFPDNTPFAGTVWAATFNEGIKVLEPTDFDGGPIAECTGADNATIDEDGDGYNNHDEIVNGTDPCDALSQPKDNDGDFISDALDTDDDNDNVADHLDKFQISAQNGSNVNIPFEFDLFNTSSGFFNVGFSGIMTNNKADQDYRDWMDKPDPANPSGDDIYGGATGTITVEMEAGTADGATNSQTKGFQIGLNSSSATGKYSLSSSMIKPFVTLSAGQSQGVQMGTGTQMDFIKIVKTVNGVEVFQEVNDVSTKVGTSIAINPTTTVEFTFIVDPTAGTVQPMYALDGGVAQPASPVINLSGALLTAVQTAGTPVAFGIIGTSAAGQPFFANWDYMNAQKEAPTEVDPLGKWEPVAKVGPYTPSVRHENGFVMLGDYQYLVGGRRTQPIERYNVKTQQWENTGVNLNNIHHFQAVALNNKIYIVGAFFSGFPNELPVQNVKIYDPETNTVTDSHLIPEEFRRGSAGAVAYNGKIYVISGNTKGHMAGAVDWMDEYDPATGVWKRLAPIPNPRDHFQAVEHNGKIYVSGGRKSDYSAGDVSEYVTAVDVYDIATNTWTTEANSTVPRAGTMSAILGEELLLIGGEHPSLSSTDVARKNVEAFNINTWSVRQLKDMLTSRHATHAIVYNEGVYVAAGSGKKGGAPVNELIAHEVFSFGDVGEEPVDAPGVLKTPQLLTYIAGTTETKLIRVENISTDANATINTIAIVGTGTAAYQILNLPELPMQLTPGQFIDLEVQFSGVTTAADAQLEITQQDVVSKYITLLKNQTPVDPGETDGIWTQVPVALINADTMDYVDSYGNIWVKDAGLYTSLRSSIAKRIFVQPKGTTEPNLFHAQRTGSLVYNIPVPNGTYDVSLNFAEIYNKMPGERMFDVIVEGGQFSLINFDIRMHVGIDYALTRVARSVIVEDGMLTVEMTAKTVESPMIAAIGIYEAVATPVELVPIANQTNLVGSESTLVAVATGGTGNITYSALELPAGLAIEPTNGLIMGNVEASALANSPYTTSIIATDANGDADTVTFSWTILEAVTPLVAANPEAQTNFVADVVDLQLEISGGTTPYAFNVTGLPDGLALDEVTYKIVGALTPASVGTHTVNVAIIDQATQTANISFTWTVQEVVAEPLVMTTPADQTNSVGAVVELQVTATGGIQPYIFEAQNLPAGLTIEPVSGLIYGTITREALEATPHAVELRLTDSQGTETTGTFTWLVQDTTSAQPLIVITPIIKQLATCEVGAQIGASVKVTPVMPYTKVWKSIDNPELVVDTTNVTPGTYEVVVTIEGHEPIAEQLVIEPYFDIEAPIVITEVADTIRVEDGAVPAPVELEVADNCDPNPKVEFVETFNEFENEVTRTWTVTDVAGNNVIVKQVVIIETVTGIEPDPLADLVVYPNPSTDKFVQVQFHHNVKELTYYVYDNMGRLALSGTLNNQYDVIDLTRLPAGTFQINFDVDGKMVKRRIILN